MKKNNELAPIVIFVYNRLEHTKRTIEALQKNILANESLLFIISDAAKDSVSQNAVESVREYISKVNGFQKVIVIEREINFGLAKSIIEGVDSVISQFGKVIVLEDDLLTSKYFLHYMNSSLNEFKEEENILSITGFSFSTEFMQFPKDYKDEIYLNIRPMSWSWATWLDRWKDVDWEVKEYDEFIKNSGQIKKFNSGGTDLTRMLKNQMNGKLNSWYIRWAFHAFKQNKLTIYPKISYVNNIGHDASGVHCDVDNNDIYSHKELNNLEIKLSSRDISLNNKIVENFNKAFNTNYKRILRRKFNIVLNFLKRKKKND